MQDIGVLGVSWRRVGAEALEPFVLPSEERAERLLRLRRLLEVEELLYLATCNRVELIYVGGGRVLPSSTELRRIAFSELTGREPRPGQALSAFDAWSGEGALEHLLLVASGLDSALLGEREIRGQLRRALALAQEHGTAGGRLEWLVEQALRIASRVERGTSLASGRRSLAEIGLRHAQAHLATRPGTVALLGVSDMTRVCGLGLAANGTPLVLVNRRPARARDMALELGAEIRSLEDFGRQPGSPSLVIAATGAAKSVLARDTLERLVHNRRDTLLIDFGVPPNISPKDAAELAMPRVGMDEICDEARRSQGAWSREAAAARLLVDEAVVQLHQDLAARAMAPVLAELSRRYRNTADERVSHLLHRELPHLEEHEQQAIRRFAGNLAKRLAHAQLRGLRALATAGEHASVNTYLAADEDGLDRLYAQGDQAAASQGAAPDHGAATNGHPELATPVVAGQAPTEASPALALATGTRKDSP